MHTAHRKRHWHHYKTHWIKYLSPGDRHARSVCGKTLSLVFFTDRIAKITCKTCQRRFAYWARRDPQ